MARRNEAEVRNPLLALPAMANLQAFLAEQPELRLHLVELLKQLGEESDEKAEYCWDRRKAPLASYWRAVAVYARHTARAIGPFKKKPRHKKLGFEEAKAQ